jgi:hypothetical protein
MMKLLETMRKAFLLTLLCAIFFNASSNAKTAFGENKNNGKIHSLKKPFPGK